LIFGLTKKQIDCNLKGVDLRYCLYGINDDLLSKLNSILDMFADSPIHPVQEHMQAATDCVTQLGDFVTALMAGNWATAEKVREQIVGLERHADDLKKQIRLNLPKGLFMVMPRGDILALLHAQDKMANRAKDVTGLMLGRRMKIPSSIADDFKAFVACVVRAAQQARKAIAELDELMEEGFRGQEVTLIEKLIHEIDDLERETDEQQIELRSKLFAVEKELPPIDAIFMYRMLEAMGSVADRAQEVGGRLQLLLAKQ
jgi:predicted phosphate transport protein (TIGR00153 family)